MNERPEAPPLPRYMLVTNNGEPYLELDARGPWVTFADALGQIRAARAELEQKQQLLDDWVANYGRWTVQNTKDNIFHLRPDLEQRLTEAEVALALVQHDNSQLRTALEATRDLLIGVQHHLGTVPGQDGYSTRMTPIEMQVADGIQSLAALLAETDTQETL